MGLPSLADFDADLIMSEVGLFVSGLSAIVGMWVERDAERPMRWSVLISMLIFLATLVSMHGAYSQAQEQAKQEASMAALLQKIDKLMQTSDVQVPGLSDLVKNEITTASRSNPGIIQKMAQRVADEGGNPSDVLGDYLPASDMRALQQSGDLQVRSRPPQKRAASKPEAAPPPRRAPPPPPPPAVEATAAVAPVPAAVAITAAPVPSPVDAGSPVVIDAGSPPKVDAGMAPAPAPAPPPEPPVQPPPPPAPPPLVTVATPARAKPAPRERPDPYDEAERELKKRRHH